MSSYSSANARLRDLSPQTRTHLLSCVWHCATDSALSIAGPQQNLRGVDTLRRSVFDDPHGQLACTPFFMMFPSLRSRVR